MVHNGIFWTIGEQSYIVYYPITSYQKIKVYMVFSIDTGRFHWNNDVSGTIRWNNGVCGTIVLIVRDMVVCSDSYYDTFVRGVIRLTKFES